MDQALTGPGAVIARESGGRHGQHQLVVTGSNVLAKGATWERVYDRVMRCTDFAIDGFRYNTRTLHQDLMELFKEGPRSVIHARDAAADGSAGS